MSYENELTTARDACWDAIDNWSTFLSDPYKFKQKYKHDSEAAIIGKLIPTLSELPAIAIAPRNVVPTWKTHRMQELAFTLIGMIWTADWIATRAEFFSIEFIKALYQSGVSANGISYIKDPTNGTGYDPKTTEVIDLIPTEIEDGNQVYVASIRVQLRINFDPFGDTA